MTFSNAAAGALKESMVHLLIAAIIGTFLFTAAYKAALGFEPPGYEITIVTLGGLAGTRAVMTGYGTYKTQVESIRVSAAASSYGPPPPSTAGGMQ